MPTTSKKDHRRPGVCPGCSAPTSMQGRRCRSCGNAHPWSAGKRAVMEVRWKDPECRAQWDASMRAGYQRWRQAQVAAPRSRATLRRLKSPGRWNAWTKREDQLLRSLAGKATPEDLADAIAELGTPRTKGSIQSRARVLDLSLAMQLVSWQGLCQIFGVGLARSKKWIDQGWIVGQRSSSNQKGSWWLFSDQDIQHFIRTHPLAYDWRKITHRRWRAEAEVAARCHGWITSIQAARVLRMPYERLHRELISTGHLATVRGPHPTRGWQFYVRRSDLSLLRG